MLSFCLKHYPIGRTSGFISSLANRVLHAPKLGKGITTGRSFASNVVSSSARGSKPKVPRGPPPKVSDLKRLFMSAKPEKWTIAAALSLLIISSGVTMSVPFCIGKVVDLISVASSAVPLAQASSASPPSSTITDSSTGQSESVIPLTEAEIEARQKLTSLCKVLIGVFLIGGVANFGRVYLIRTSGQRIIKRIREDLYTSILRQETAFFDRSKTGELVNRLSGDTAVMGEGLTLNISDGLRSVAQAIGGVGMMLYVSPKLTLVSVAIVPPIACLSIVYGRYVRQMTSKVQDSLAKITEEAEERISNIRTVRAFGQERLETDRYAKATDIVLQLSNKEALARAGFFGTAGLGGNMMVLSVLYYGSLMMHDSQLTIGGLSAFLLYAAYVSFSMGGLSSFYTELMRSVGASQRVWLLIDRKPEIAPPRNNQTPKRLPSLEGHLKFNNIAFSYPSRIDAPVLTSLDLDIHPCSVLAVVGPSGSGKSTLASLLLRHYDPTEGSISVDGHDLRDLDLIWWRQQIGTVLQDPVLFSCSIGENIAYGSPDPFSVSLARIEKAAEQANALAFIKSLPSGFDTIVGERGVLLSGGQRQRVSIARAIIKDPKILLLDEATSSLDAESEFLVQSALETVVKGRTVVTIAHRLSTILSANQIAVLGQDGKVAELGTYQELMERGPEGHFRKLVDRQMLGQRASL